MSIKYSNKFNIFTEQYLIYKQILNSYLQRQNNVLYTRKYVSAIQPTLHIYNYKIMYYIGGNMSVYFSRL